MFGKEYEELISTFKTFPGVGKKQAEKFFYFLLNKDIEFFQDLSQKIIKLKQNLQPCERCNFVSLNVVCSICLDPDRSSQIMLVENSSDVIKFENLRFYEGKYFVFDYKKGVDNKYLTAKINKLRNLIRENTELIVAFSFNIEGLVLANFVMNHKDLKNVKISKLASGIPLGAQIEYVDELTLKEAIKNRK
ncbi:toprim domain-containing protein [Mesomycoplasma hyorhinis]|jgi:recombination protein RecR|uniref:Recombination protein RecR n=3 Tax=Mesomycoplasma hyorhinis TaxID=2100 RepID=A0ABD6IE28_MESHY|nr:toprim domain-containing protein [Mesomycoplasma hyorhinis]ADM21575.1 Recombination protein [Mesomycoplasma hyorhinis HUB-1]AEC45878.1 recombination protein RecR [Mesomycoplasma hyorhinis MCLD]AEX13907.1 recombination protein recR [Mesomycoplasma hyorhinis GDL-1]AFX74047.1 Recombination protein RecR [Mesomycoplasma hyorhinis SK76]AHA40869.1 Recombination protein RecR [Mesomycoplasma hyorhinis DBS 1050]CRH25435.1 recombination protein RecR [Chlamydia trachomatis]